jgi:hypothetical protein
VQAQPPPCRLPEKLPNDEMNHGTRHGQRDPPPIPVDDSFLQGRLIRSASQEEDKQYLTLMINFLAFDLFLFIAAIRNVRYRQKCPLLTIEPTFTGWGGILDSTTVDTAIADWVVNDSGVIILRETSR